MLSSLRKPWNQPTRTHKICRDLVYNNKQLPSTYCNSRSRHQDQPASGPGEGQECYRWGGKHFASQCRFSNAVCRTCKNGGTSQGYAKASTRLPPDRLHRAPIGYKTKSMKRLVTTTRTHLLQEEVDEVPVDKVPVYTMFNLPAPKPQPYSLQFK